MMNGMRNIQPKFNNHINVYQLLDFTLSKKYKNLSLADWFRGSGDSELRKKSLRGRKFKISLAPVKRLTVYELLFVSSLNSLNWAENP